MSAEKKRETERVYSTTEAKNQFNALLNFVQAPDAVAVIESHGRAKGALISAAELETLRRLKEQERRRQAWKKLEALRKEVSARNTDLSEDDAMELATQAVREAFQELHDSGRLYNLPPYER
jgi:prevent-host-death family protein